MKTTLKAAAVLALALPAATAFAQYTGVSHPDEVPITTSPEGIAQPVVYTPTPIAPTPALKPRPALPAAEPTPTAFVTAASTTSVQTDIPQELAAAQSDGIKPFLTTPAQEARVVTRVDGPANQLPAGTLLKVRLGRELSTRITAGTPFTAELAEAVERDGHVLLPAGSIISGKVSEVHGGRRVTGNASLHLRPDTVTLPDGTAYPLRAQVVDTDLYKSTKVDHEGTIQRKDHALKTAAAFAVSTGSGAAAGAVFGGWPGALIGAGVGAGVSAVVWLRQDRQAELPAGTRMVIALTGPMECGTR